MKGPAIRTCSACGQSMTYLPHLDRWAHLCFVEPVPNKPNACPQCRRPLDDEAGHEACSLFRGDGR